MEDFLAPMQPLPHLAEFARRVPLPRLDISLFVYDTREENTPAAFLIHGLGDDADLWRHIIPQLASLNRVIAADLPGFARSDKPPGDYTLPFLCESLGELMDELSIHQATLIGNSLGALIAQQIALENPERVGGLVLVAGSLLAPRQPLKLQNLLSLTPGVGEWLYTRLRKDPQKAYESLRPYYAAFDEISDSDKKFLYKRVNQRVWNDEQRRAYFSTLRNSASYIVKLQKGLDKRLSKIEIPTLILWGQKDYIISVSNAYRLAEIQNSAKLIVLPESGHVPQQEHPGAFLEAVRSDEKLSINNPDLI